ncbi:tyrosine-type recombinase/integrase [Actinomadura sp. 6N118]|uniref:tyrosine-type recombinase/integrase n=1 Tax=Actinomadura sp. 6N118 TaxID=3375151 RepID=UPI0037A97CEA
MAKGSIYKRCGCRHPDTGKPVGACCPSLRRRDGAWNPRHGSWHYRLELPPRTDGTRRTPIRRGSLADRDTATAQLTHLSALIDGVDADDDEAVDTLAAAVKHAISTGSALPTAEHLGWLLRTGHRPGAIPTLAEWLPQWLAGKKNIGPSTYTLYEGHIRRFFIPYLGHIRLDRLTIAHIADMFDWIEERNDQIRAARTSDDPELRAAFKWQKVAGPATKQRIRSTLRAALNAAIVHLQGLITFNPAAHVELPPAHRPKPLVWTTERVRRWHDTGDIPGPVMVWTPQHTGTFLDHTLHDRLYALYHLLAFCGLRRGEACGLHWSDLDLDTGVLTVRLQLTAPGQWTPLLSTPRPRRAPARSPSIRPPSPPSGPIAAANKPNIRPWRIWPDRVPGPTTDWCSPSPPVSQYIPSRSPNTSKTSPTRPRSPDPTP